MCHDIAIYRTIFNNQQNSFNLYVYQKMVITNVWMVRNPWHLQDGAFLMLAWVSLIEHKGKYAKYFDD